MMKKEGVSKKYSTFTRLLHVINIVTIVRWREGIIEL